MKRVTITYTRQNEETPWYWQAVPSTLEPVDSFLGSNSSQMETYSYVHENQNVVTFTFNAEQIYQEFLAMIDADVKTDYKQYCDDNNITIDVVTEDV
jgi:hypothetical protein